MRTLVTKSILLLGRYAVLPVAVLAGALFVGWLAAFDTFPGMAVIALPVVLPISTVARACVRLCWARAEQCLAIPARLNMLCFFGPLAFFRPA